MREHMQKEEQRLFNVARTLLGPQDVKRLQCDFAEVELGPMGPAFHEWYEALAERLTAPVKKDL
jgi:hemerythrin-like domain-containing protein